MGADYKGQERGIEELRAISNEARMFLAHHLRNSINGIIGGIKTGRLEMAEQEAWHMVEDLEKIGC